MNCIGLMENRAPMKPRGFRFRWLGKRLSVGWGQSPRSAVAHARPIAMFDRKQKSLSAATARFAAGRCGVGTALPPPSCPTLRSSRASVSLRGGKGGGQRGFFLSLIGLRSSLPSSRPPGEDSRTEISSSTPGPVNCRARGPNEAPFLAAAHAWPPTKRGNHASGGRQLPSVRREATMRRSSVNRHIDGRSPSSY